MHATSLNNETVRGTLSWLIANHSCPTTANVSAPECRSTHSSCLEDTSLLLYGCVDAKATDHLTSGYTCECSDGYQGNPYVGDDGLDACQDIDECTSPERYNCYGDCKNTPGSFICMCPDGYVGNASFPNGCQDIKECENPEAHSCYGTCQNFPGGFQCQCPDGTYGNPRIKDGCIIVKRKNSLTGLSIGLGVGGGTSLFLALVAPFITRKIKLQKVNSKGIRLWSFKVMKEEDKDEAKQVAAIAAMCLRLKGEDRPKMRYMEMRLQGLQGLDVYSYSSGMEEQLGDLNESTFQGGNAGVGNNYSSRQYSMEEEILLSASL
ncbi:unnamed protein product [Miscanthus lutarioriparius]|uniref:Uncharacterized protein n=1 Tax=Miscanthus lutarioriparius TaxID=422564 RepID=A0A811PJH5_9POAL|nr:unnamed protein product [Miscanthus lutarioriparius]